MAALGRQAEKLIDALAVVIFAAMFGVIILQIVLRYVFNHPMVWTDEAAQYLFVWISFLGWTMATRKRIHIGISVVIDRLPAPLRRGLQILWSAATVAFALTLFAVGVKITLANRSVQMVSIDFAFWPVYLVVPLASGFLVVYALRDLLAIFRKGDIKTIEAQL